jgi:transposase
MERTESVLEERTAPSPEVLERPVRRRFTVEYKARILAEADACTEPGRLGELLRREGLYSSHLTTWRRQRDEGALAGLTPKRRGRKAKPKSPLADEVARLQRENQRLKEQLRQAELIIDVQKKVSEMLKISRKTQDGEGNG